MAQARKGTRGNTRSCTGKPTVDSRVWKHRLTSQDHKDRSRPSRDSEDEAPPPPDPRRRGAARERGRK